MKITFTNSEIKALDKVTYRLGLEFLHLSTVIDTQSDEQYYIKDFPFSSSLSEEDVNHINSNYGPIAAVEITEGGYEVTVNEEFIVDYADLYQDVAVEMFKWVKDAVNGFNFIIMPMLKKFVEKWKDLM